jgi:hypothetical protein
MESDLEQRGGGETNLEPTRNREPLPKDELRELLQQIERGVSRESPGAGPEFSALEAKIKDALRHAFGDPELGFDLAEERLNPGYLVAFYLPDGQIFAGVNDVRERAFLIAAQEALRSGAERT